MKQVYNLSIFLLLSVIVIFVSCSDDDDKKQIETGITSHSWTDDKPMEISTGTPLSVNFNTSAQWTAISSSSWCSLLATSGEKGQNTLKLLVTTAASTDRTSTITIKVEGYSSASFKVTQKASGSTVSEDMEVNGKVDQYLREMYLWNDEYKGLELDFIKKYDDFFYDALGSMTTNTLDKRYEPDGIHYNLFSYIQKRNTIRSVRATQLEKELAYSFGITGITPVSIGTSSDFITYFCIQGVYPDSPAEQAGIKRGSLISQIDGNKIVNSNISDYFYNLLYPDAAFSLNLTEGIVEKGTKDIVVTSKAMYCNPVITSKVEDVNGYKIGYLVYAGFDAGFDQELFDVFKEFKSNNVKDLILDLRYNGGGHTISANLIATCIAGEASRGKVFTSLRYNKERMEKLNNKRDDEEFAYSNYANLRTSLSAGSLGLSRVYCLVGNGTASASELVINSLRGIDVEVILIGEKTTGKNVGMEYDDLTVRNNVYRIVPITFQSYNAKGFGDYENGFEPASGLQIDETNPDNESGRFVIYKEYGTMDEPLYAKAIELITGRKVSTVARSMENVTAGKVHKMPAIYRPGYSGMLKKYESQTE